MGNHNQEARCLQADSDTRKSMLADPRSEEVAFAHDSALEEAGFEPSVPLYILTVSDPILVGPSHGDIKPQNILISAECVKLTDFGSSVLPEDMYARTRENGEI